MGPCPIVIHPWYKEIYAQTNKTEGFLLLIIDFSHSFLSLIKCFFVCVELFEHIIITVIVNF